MTVTSADNDLPLTSYLLPNHSVMSEDHLDLCLTCGGEFAVDQYWEILDLWHKKALKSLIKCDIKPDIVLGIIYS